jgi:hypothetical protein
MERYTPLVELIGLKNVNVVFAQTAPRINRYRSSEKEDLEGGKADIQSCLCLGQVEQFDIGETCLLHFMYVEFKKESTVRAEVDLYPTKHVILFLKHLVEYLSFGHILYCLQSHPKRVLFH